MEIAIAAWDAHGAIQYDGGGLRQDAIDTLEKLETNEAVTGGPTLDDMVPGLAKALAKALGWDRRATDMGEGRKSYARTDVGNAERLHALCDLWSWGEARYVRPRDDGTIIYDRGYIVPANLATYKEMMDE